MSDSHIVCIVSMVCLTWVLVSILVAFSNDNAIVKAGNRILRVVTTIFIVCILVGFILGSLGFFEKWRRVIMTEQTRLDDLVETLMSDGNSICDFCKNKDECDELASITKPPRSRVVCCSVFDIDKMEDAIDEIVHREG